MGKTLLLFLMALFLATLVAYPTYGYEEDGDPIVDPNIRLEIPIGESPEGEDYNREAFKIYAGRNMKRFLERCLMTLECGREIYEEMLQNKRASDDCCLHMLEKGKECHIEMAKLWFTFYELRLFASRALPKSYVVWDRCYRDVGTHAPSPKSI